MEQQDEQQHKPAVYRSKDLRLHAVTLQVTCGGRDVGLPNLSRRLLLALLEAAPAAISVDRLMQQVWGDVQVSPETLTQRIALLRKALSGHCKDAAHCIESVRNYGYRWLWPVQQVPESSAVQAPRRALWLSLSAAALLLLLLGSALIWRHSRGDETAQSPPGAAFQAEDLSAQAWRYLDKHDAPSNRLAIDLFRQSLAMREGQVNALTGLSIALSHAVTKFNGSDEWLEEAGQLARAAIDLSPDHAQAWAALAFKYDADGDIDGAIPLYEKAAQLAPGNSSTISSLAYLYAVKGRLVEALRLSVEVLGTQQRYGDLQIAQILELLGFQALAEQWYRKADALFPDSVFATHLRARYHLSHNQPGQAQAVIDAALARGIVRPELMVLNGILALHAGQASAALPWFQRAVEINPQDAEAAVWLWTQRPCSERSAAEREAFRVHWFSGAMRWPEQWVLLALVEQHCGHTAAAIEALQEAHSRGHLNHRWLEKLPTFAGLMQTPAFLAVLERMQNTARTQRQQIIEADWLPASFLDPQSGD